MKAISPIALLIASVIPSQVFSAASIVRTETGLECANENRSAKLTSHLVCTPEK
jgi:hypothetical protein